jgi:hypothetical protein
MGRGTDVVSAFGRRPDCATDFGLALGRPPFLGPARAAASAVTRGGYPYPPTARGRPAPRSPIRICRHGGPSLPLVGVRSLIAPHATTGGVVPRNR